MTTDATRDAPASPAWPRLVRQATAAFAIWMAALILLTALVEPTRDVVVVGPVRASLAALAGSDTRIGDVGRITVTVRGSERGFVQALYAGGAWLVLPSRVGGCLGARQR